MLRSVLENYVSTLSEREFDIPLLCLLLGNDFFDIHYLHGMFEFGKDFIAKKVEDGNPVQYVFQSKAGDINLSDWRGLRTQIDEMRTNYAAHPNYDEVLPLAAIAVITGRLVGGAAISSQEYDRYCRGRGEAGFQIWDLDRIIELIMQSDPLICSPSGSARFLQVIGALRQNEGNFKEVEAYSRCWFDVCTSNASKEAYLGVILESSLLCHEMVSWGRTTLACYTVLMALRAMMAGIQTIGTIPDWAVKLLHLLENQFIQSANSLKESVNQLMPKPTFYDSSQGAVGFVEYPVLCSQTIEILGLLALLHWQRGNYHEHQVCVDILEAIISNNPGCLHPISDKYAVSLIIPTLMLVIKGSVDVCKELLRGVCKWVCDRYEQSEGGLADVYADEDDEVKHLLGYAYDFILVPTRRESYLATVTLDLAVVLNLTEVYEEIINEYLATMVCPSLVLVRNDVDQYIIHGRSPHCPNLTYPEKWSDYSSGSVPVHHREAPGLFAESGYIWEALSISSVTRERYRVSELREVLLLLKAPHSTISV